MRDLENPPAHSTMEVSGMEAAVRANRLNSATRLLAALDGWGARGGWVLPPAQG